MVYFLLLIFRSLIVVTVGITAVGIFSVVIAPNSSLVVIPAILFYGLLIFGIPSIIGMMPLLWVQDNRSLGDNKLFNVLFSCFYGFVIGFLVVVIWPRLFWKPSFGFEWGFVLTGALGGAIGGLYAGIRYVRKPAPKVTSRVTWAD